MELFGTQVAVVVQPYPVEVAVQVVAAVVVAEPLTTELKPTVKMVW